MSEHRVFPRRAQRSDKAERGSSLIGLLIVILILGLMAAATLGSLGYASNPALTGVPLTMPGGGAIVTTTTTTTTTTTAAIIPSTSNYSSTTAIANCRADYAMVSAAVRIYQQLRGAPPPAGTAWSHTVVNGGPLLRLWQRDIDYYSIVWNGSTLSVVPINGMTAHGSAGANSPPTGCFAA